MEKATKEAQCILLSLWYDMRRLAKVGCVEQMTQALKEYTANTMEYQFHYASVKPDKPVKILKSFSTGDPVADLVQALKELPKGKAREFNTDKCILLDMNGQRITVPKFRPMKNTDFMWMLEKLSTS